ncbi:hypothetical protein CK203_041589 [Vitis vinifera]|uniref:Uncharacterized protein n=1 Tax=Vitis vinifera TaxID=29760 RepID=A0A438I7J5_VITVI|nr:hypothetical protein CK203_041589 [Vitis vinifera]
MGKIPYQNFMGVAGYDDYSLNEWIPIDACNIRIREVVFHLTALQDTAHLAVRMTPPINGIRYAGCSRYSEADSRRGDPAGALFRSMLLRDYVAMQSCEESCEISGPDSEVGVDKETELVTRLKIRDVDRFATVDSTGHELNRNRLIALMSAIVLEEQPGTTTATDSVTSDGLTTYIEKELGGKHHCGHGALKENHWLDDGVYHMVKLLSKLASARAFGIGGGSKVLTDLGWFLLRLSLHDPVLPLNIEAPSHDDAVKLGLAVLAAVKEFPALDSSTLDKFVQSSLHVHLCMATFGPCVIFYFLIP